MTDQELEQKLRTALEHAAPDDFQGVLARISPKARTEQAPIPFEAAAGRRNAAGPRWRRPPAWPWWLRQAEAAGTCKITRWPRWSPWT